jgi:hypothetical protein
MELLLPQFVRGEWSPESIAEQQLGLAVMLLEMSTQPCFKFLGHWQVRTAGLRLHCADRSRGRVNTLPDADNVFCEVHIRLAKRECLTDPQAEHSRNRNDCAEWLWCIGDDSPHFIISEATRLSPDVITGQGQVCKAKSPHA